MSCVVACMINSFVLQFYAGIPAGTAAIDNLFRQFLAAALIKRSSYRRSCLCRLILRLSAYAEASADAALSILQNKKALP